MDNKNRENVQGSGNKDELNKPSDIGKNKSDTGAGFGNNPRKSGQEYESGGSSRSGLKESETDKNPPRTDSEH
jgi:hypothetical protein